MRGQTCSLCKLESEALRVYGKRFKRVVERTRPLVLRNPFAVGLIIEPSFRVPTINTTGPSIERARWILYTQLRRMREG